MPGYRQLARNRDFTVLWVGDTVSELGSALSMFVFPLIAYALSGSAITAAARRGRLPRRPVRDAAARGRAGRPARPPADHARRQRAPAARRTPRSRSRAHSARSPSPTWSAAALVSGVAAGAFNPAQTSAIRSVVSTEDLPTALSQNQARQHVASLLGGPLGGALYAVTRWLPFAVDALTFAIACVTVSRVRTDLSAPHRRREPLRRQLTEGFAVHLGAAVLPDAAGVGVADQPGHQRDLLRDRAADGAGGRAGGPDRPRLDAAGVGGMLGAALAPSLIHRLPTGAPHRASSGGCAACRWCR